jgi:hypothetical protein
LVEGSIHSVDIQVNAQNGPIEKTAGEPMSKTQKHLKNPRKQYLNLVWRRISDCCELQQRCGTLRWGRFPLQLEPVDSEKTEILQNRR